MKTFTVTYATGSHRNNTYGFISSLCEECDKGSPGASIGTMQGKHWRTLATTRKFSTNKQAIEAAKDLRRPSPVA